MLREKRPEHDFFFLKWHQKQLLKYVTTTQMQKLKITHTKQSFYSADLSMPQQLSIMTTITKVTGPDKHLCSLEHMPQVTKTKMTTTKI